MRRAKPLVEFEALLKVLDRRGLVPKAEVLEEIKRLRETAPKGRWERSMCGRFSLGASATTLAARFDLFEMPP